MNLRRMWRNATHQHAHRKPLNGDFFAEVWLEDRYTIWYGLWDDWRRYGAKIALKNFWFMLTKW